MVQASQFLGRIGYDDLHKFFYREFSPIERAHLTASTALQTVRSGTPQIPGPRLAAAAAGTRAISGLEEE